MELTKKQKDELFGMKIGDRFQTQSYDIIRVPGGWIYKFNSGSVFVPYVYEIDYLH